MQKLNSFFLLLAVLFSLTACSTVIQKPQISVNKIALDRVSFRESSATFSLNVKNPNGFAIYLSGIEYALSLNGTPVAGGENSNRMKIAAGTEEVIQIPVRLQVAKLFRMIPTFLRERQVKYQLNGKVKTPLINIPFQRTGGVNVSQ